jgi:hypothetical protein
MSHKSKQRLSKLNAINSIQHSNKRNNNNNSQYSQLSLDQNQEEQTIVVSGSHKISKQETRYNNENKPHMQLAVTMKRSSHGVNSGIHGMSRRRNVVLSQTLNEKTNLSQINQLNSRSLPTLSGSSLKRATTASRSFETPKLRMIKRPHSSVIIANMDESSNNSTSSSYSIASSAHSGHNYEGINLSLLKSVAAQQQQEQQQQSNNISRLSGPTLLYYTPKAFYSSDQKTNTPIATSLSSSTNLNSTIPKKKDDATLFSHISNKIKNENDHKIDSLKSFKFDLADQSKTITNRSEINLETQSLKKTTNEAATSQTSFQQSNTITRQSHKKENEVLVPVWRTVKIKSKYKLEGTEVD